MSFYFNLLQLTYLPHQEQENVNFLIQFYRDLLCHPYDIRKENIVIFIIM